MTRVSEACYIFGSMVFELQIGHSCRTHGDYGPLTAKSKRFGFLFSIKLALNFRALSHAFIHVYKSFFLQNFCYSCWKTQRTLLLIRSFILRFCYYCKVSHSLNDQPSRFPVLIIVLGLHVPLWADINTLKWASRGSIANTPKQCWRTWMWYFHFNCSTFYLVLPRLLCNSQSSLILLTTPALNHTLFLFSTKIHPTWTTLSTYPQLLFGLLALSATPSTEHTTDSRPIPPSWLSSYTPHVSRHLWSSTP